MERDIGRLTDHYIICGAGRDGRSVARVLAAKPVPFVVIEQSGPEHSTHFVVEARVEGYEAVRGEAGAKRDAQRAAASAFLAAHARDE